MWHYKTDLIPGPFPGELKWTEEESIESLQKIYQFLIDECDKAIKWYFAKKCWKRILGYMFRSVAILLLGISAIIPVWSQISKTSAAPGISPMWATVAVVIAGILIGFDRFGGWTSSWIRFVQTAQALSRLRLNFQIEWEQYRLALSEGRSDSVTFKDGLEKCRNFFEQTQSKINAETDQWAQEFQKALVEIEAKSKPK